MYETYRCVLVDTPNHGETWDGDCDTTIVPISLNDTEKLSAYTAFDTEYGFPYHLTPKILKETQNLKLGQNFKNNF